MITVYRFGRKTKKKVGDYEGNTNDLKDIFRAMDLARKDCPTGKLIIEGVAICEEKK